MKDRMKAWRGRLLVPLDLCTHQWHVNPLVQLSLSGSSHLLPWSFISMRGYQDPATIQRIVSPMRYVIKNSIWHDSLQVLLPNFVIFLFLLDI